MTQPIQEPTTQRSVSRLTWGENQLFRRPAPPTGDNRPWARLAKPFPDGTFYPNQVIANNTDETLEFDETYNLDSGDSGFDYFSAVGTPINTLRIETPGLYSVTFECIWNDAQTFPWYISVSGDGMNWPHRFHFGYWDTSGSEEAKGTGTYVHRYEANDDLEVHIYQRSGGNRTLNAFYLEAVYLGSWSGIALDDMLPVQ